MRCCFLRPRLYPLRLLPKISNRGLPHARRACFAQRPDRLDSALRWLHVRRRGRRKGRPFQDQLRLLPNSKKGFTALGVCVYITVVGLLVIKLNFLLFFKPLGTGFRSFHIAWWIVTVFTVGGAVVLCGLQEIRCLFGPIDYILGGECVDKSILRRIFVKSVFSVVVDVLSDILSEISP